ncbi:MAG: Fur family transcriptional regulator [Acidimicrobiales bacterium]
MTRHATDEADVHEQVARRLGRKDQRYTQARRQLVRVLLTARRPVTLPDISELAPDLAQSSVYRNLDVLERSEVIRRISVGSEFAHFELTEDLLGHHHHLICVECGHIDDVHLDDDVERMVEQHLAAVAERSGFAPLHHSLDLHGRCAECQASQPAPILET